MRYFRVEPEVAGGWGSRTVVNRNLPPWVITKLHYHFEGWLGDGLLESFPAFIIVDDARYLFKKHNLTGFLFADVEITTSEEFELLNSCLQLPKFIWLKVDGLAKYDDFGIGSDGRL